MVDLTDGLKSGAAIRLWPLSVWLHLALFCVLNESACSNQLFNSPVRRFLLFRKSKSCSLSLVYCQCLEASCYCCDCVRVCGSLLGLIKAHLFSRHTSIHDLFHPCATWRTLSSPPLGDNSPLCYLSRRRVINITASRQLSGAGWCREVFNHIPLIVPFLRRDP